MCNVFDFKSYPNSIFKLKLLEVLYIYSVPIIIHLYAFKRELLSTSYWIIVECTTIISGLNWSPYVQCPFHYYYYFAYIKQNKIMYSREYLVMIEEIFLCWCKQTYFRLQNTNVYSNSFWSQLLLDSTLFRFNWEVLFYF